MGSLELVCAAIVLVYWVGKLVATPERWEFCARMLVLSCAAWVGENTVIAAYGRYQYADSWSVFLHHVPLMIILIWPVVILSAWDLSRSLLAPSTRACNDESRDKTRWIPLLGGLFVALDASLIEPISVHARLWWWTEPGLFHVPPIAILGWATFAVAAMAVFERSVRVSALSMVLVLVIAPAAAHLAIVGSWHMVFRWVNGTIPAWPGVAVVWILCVFLCERSLRFRLRERVPLREMLLRVPGASFFFVLLFTEEAPLAMVVYALAFAPPYLSLLRLGSVGGETSTSAQSAS